MAQRRIVPMSDANRSTRTPRLRLVRGDEDDWSADRDELLAELDDSSDDLPRYGSPTVEVAAIPRARADYLEKAGP
jgi:hypothetical protein